MTVNIGFSVCLGEFLEIFVLKRYQRNYKNRVLAHMRSSILQTSNKKLQPGASFRKMIGTAEFLIGPFWGANLGNTLYDLKACFESFVYSNVGNFLQFGLQLENGG